MKIYNPWNFIPELAPRRRGEASETAPEAFGALLKERCQGAGAAAPQAGAADSPAALAASVLDLLERIALQLGSGATARDMAASHEQLARQAEQLRRLGESLPPGPLKGVLAETSALSYLQLWRFEQGEFV